MYKDHVTCKHNRKQKSLFLADVWRSVVLIRAVKNWRKCKNISKRYVKTLCLRVIARMCSHVSRRVFKREIASRKPLQVCFRQTSSPSARNNFLSGCNWSLPHCRWCERREL